MSSLPRPCAQADPPILVFLRARLCPPICSDLFRTPHTARILPSTCTHSMLLCALVCCADTESDTDKVSEPDSSGIEGHVGYVTWKSEHSCRACRRSIHMPAGMPLLSRALLWCPPPLSLPHLCQARRMAVGPLHTRATCQRTPPAAMPSPAAAIQKPTSLKFDTITSAVTDEEKHSIRFSPKVTLYRLDRTFTPLKRKPLRNKP